MGSTALSPWPQSQFPAQQFCDESERLRVIASYGLGGLQDDPGLTEIAGFAARLCEAPIALVSLVEKDRQLFLAREGLDAAGTPRSSSFCAHAMLGSTVMVIHDASADPQFMNNPLVTGDPHIRFYAGMPLISSDGAPLGALCVIDRHARAEGLTPLQEDGLRVMAQAVMQRLEGHRSHRFADDLRQSSELRFRTIIECLPDITWSANPKGEITYINRRWTEYTGLPAYDHDSDHIRSAYHPDEVGPWRDDWLAAIKRGEPYEGEYRLRRKDGSFGWIMARAVPLHDPDGQIESWFGQLIDIDDRHRQADARELLARELAHRIRNIFSVIGGLVSLRSRGRPELGQFAEDLVGSIHALGRAQDFIHPLGESEDDDLGDLLRSLMAPYQEADQQRVSVQGDRVRVGAKATTPLALIFHELATNAAKYGALSERKGTVAIDLSIDQGSVAISWQESGGPPIESPPDMAGFGSRLVRSVTRSQLSGTLSMYWHREGLKATIRLPLESIAR